MTPRTPKRSCETCRRRKLKCEGERPTCYYCATRNLECIYIGTRLREDAEAKRLARIERQILRLTHPRRQRMEFQPQISSAFERLSLSIHLSPSDNPISKPFRLRPGAAPCEELDLMEEFFERATLVSRVIHKRTYRLNYQSMPSYLRFAVCAAGAGNRPFSKPSQEVTDWYMEQAIAGLDFALQHPSFDCMQALLILPPTSSCTPSGYHSEQLRKLAVFLRLDIDPDYLPELGSLSWAEKEARRRCWWHLFIADQIFSTILYRTPALSRRMSTVKPACAEGIWTSSKPLASPNPSDLNCDTESPINWQVQLVEIFHRIALASRDRNGEMHAVKGEVKLLEQQLEAELVRWWNVVPSTFWKVLATEDDLYQSMLENPDTWLYAIDLFFQYHSAVCLLMRRKTLAHLQDLSSATTDWNDSAEDVSEQLDNQAGFAMGMRSAESIASLISMLDRTNAFVHRLPNFAVYFSAQAVVTLLIVQIALKNRSSQPRISAFNLCPSAATSELPFVPDALDDEANWATLIDSYLWLLKSMTSSRTLPRLFARFFYKFAANARRGDWRYLDGIDENQKVLLDDVELPQVTTKSPRHPADASANPYAVTGDVMIMTVRSYIRMFRAAREIGRSLSPPPPPLVEADPDLFNLGTAQPAMQTSTVSQWNSGAEIGPAMPPLGLFEDSTVPGLGGNEGGSGDCGWVHRDTAHPNSIEAFLACDEAAEAEPMVDVTELLDWLLAVQNEQ
ncbi:hypothetical protein DFJ73DRAFT_167837 [Zopfochytrium polystomum]|nr:hypothetical protein DFJ73DRAFT_167837 [Zopfochytrium polystomum]